MQNADAIDDLVRAAAGYALSIRVQIAVYSDAAAPDMGDGVNASLVQAVEGLRLG